MPLVKKILALAQLKREVLIFGITLEQIRYGMRESILVHSSLRPSAELGLCR